MPKYKTYISYLLRRSIPNTSVKRATVSTIPITIKYLAVPFPVSARASAAEAATLPWKNAERPMTMPIPNQKSKVVAGLLGIFLGSFGVHNFYLGYTTKGIIQLVGTIVSYLLACFVIGIFTAAGIAIWGFVEGILIFSGNISVDGYGNPIGE